MQKGDEIPFMRRVLCFDHSSIGANTLSSIRIQVRKTDLTC